MGTSAMKRLMRGRVWFPRMDYVKSCLPFVAITPDHQREPLKSNPLPADLWDTVYVNHWGPTRDGEHIDTFSKFRGYWSQRDICRSQHRSIHTGTWGRCTTPLRSHDRTQASHSSIISCSTEQLLILRQGNLQQNFCSGEDSESTCHT